MIFTYVIQFVVAFFATLGFAIIFSSPKSELAFCGFTGALGWIIYYIILERGMHFVVACLIATMCLTIIARALAVIRKSPGTTYLLTGIFPLVPGAGIYYTAYYLFTGDQAMFAAKGMETFETAAAIVFGIIFGFSIPQKLFSRLGGFHRGQSS
jgi:uncharacterized membrane protein YjjB (DUF3815 family)